MTRVLVEGPGSEVLWDDLSCRRFGMLLSSRFFPELDLPPPRGAAGLDQTSDSVDSVVSPSVSGGVGGGVGVGSGGGSCVGRQTYFTMCIGWREFLCRTALHSSAPRLLAILHGEIVDLTDFLVSLTGP